MSKGVVILGSTGSIGRRTLDVIRSLGDGTSVAALTACDNWQALAGQAREFTPRRVAVAKEQFYSPLKDALSDLPVEVLAGPDAVKALAGDDQADFVLCAIVGSASIEPALAAVQAGKTVGLASKEAMVVGGPLILAEAQKTAARIIPVDSEHSAIFQALQTGQPKDVAAIVLTASGGPFLDWPVDRIRSATLDQALNHPTWSMGRKITIDSATMMNKALEIVEAHRLFGLPADAVKVVIHPESIVHGLVEFTDGTLIAQLAQPDMAAPIQYALTWPERRPCIAAKLDLAQIGQLTFQEPDHEKFPALELAYEAAERDGTAPAVLNAANEQAVDCFIQKRIPFGRIVDVTAEVLSQHRHKAGADLADLLEIDRWARNEVIACLKR